MGDHADLTARLAEVAHNLRADDEEVDLLRERDEALAEVAQLRDANSQARFREMDLLNERLWLRANVYRMAMALMEIDDQAMTLLAGRTDTWPLIDAIERGHAAWHQLVEKYPDPYTDDDAMLRAAGCVLDVRPTAKRVICDHPEHARRSLAVSEAAPEVEGGPRG